MDNNTPIVYDENYQVIQANELIRSKQEDVSLVEAKLIRLAIMQILKNDTDLQTYSCNIVDLANFLGLGSENIYREIDAVTERLMRRIIYIKIPGKYDKHGNPHFERYHWVETAKYADGVITYKLSSELKPYLIGLDELFTEYGYEAIIGLPTNYSIRLYELIASYQNISLSERKKIAFFGIDIEKNEFIFTIEYLREYFNCEDKYPNTGDFIKRVIEGSVTAIRRHTVMRISYRTVKRGRAIGFVVFKIHAWNDEEYKRILCGK